MSEGTFVDGRKTILALAMIIAASSLACAVVADADGETGGGWYYEQLSPVEKTIYDSARYGGDPTTPFYVPEPYSSMEFGEFCSIVESSLEGPYMALKCEWTLGNDGNESLGIGIGSDGHGNYVAAALIHTSLYTDDEAAYEDVMSALQSVPVDSGSRFSAVVSIHDAVCAMLEYERGYKEEKSYSMYNAVCGDHVVVCEGYAKTFLALCQIHGIPCVGVLGTVLTSSGWQPHMYNMVQMDDGAWYAVDTTWDDQDEIVHTYLLAGSNTEGFDGIAFSASHVPSGLTPPPLSSDAYEPAFVTFAFDAVTGTLTVSGNGAIPDGSGSSPWNAFKDAARSIVVGDGITSVGSKAFYGFENVQSVSIGASVSSIGSKAFAYCGSLESLEIPGNVRTVEGYAFYHGGIKSLAFDKGVKTIGEGAFQGCPIDHVAFASGITRIGSGAFSGCSFYDADGETRLSPTPGLLSGYTFDGSPSKLVLVTKFVKGFTFTKGSLKYSVTSSLASDRQLAVVGYAGNPSDLVIPARVNTTAGYFPVTSIGTKAFYGCETLRSVDLGEVSTIGAKAFARCTSLEALEIGSSVKTVSQYAFYGCTSLKTLDIIGDGTGIDVSAFSECRNLVRASFIGSGISIGTNSFYNCVGLADLDLAGVSSVGFKAFPYCNGIVSLTIPGTVGSIGDYAFFKCANVSELVISDGVKKVGKSAFSGCGKIECIDFGSTVSSIGTNAFYGYKFTDAEGNALALASLPGHLFQGYGKNLTLVR
ncbi:MAG: leucine-rich repeat protein [Candidatus Methanomethylophilaceae archaeon]|nr:leucine-rich repeat protein [Candidatus Methanomethylophilaceae archaeon]